MVVVPASLGPRLDEAPGLVRPRYGPLLRRLEAGGPVVASHSRLVEGALGVSARPGFEVFVCTPRLRFEPFDYQLRAAGAVLRRMRGRAILADEVGLGKTVEAGLVISELRLRRLARRVLVLAPTGVLEQWREELDRKFALPSELATSAWSGGSSEGDEPILLASLAAARRPPLRDAIAGERWDLVVVDEAHRVRNPRSASGRLVRSLSSRYLLMLTATPVENRLDDLFQLVSMVTPGLLGTAQQFRARHGPTSPVTAAGSAGSAGSGSSAGQPGGVRDLSELRSRLSGVMVRHRRSEVALMLPRRLAHTIRVNPTPEEADLYRLLSDRVRSEGRTAAPSHRLALQAAQRLAGSSPSLTAALLGKLGWDDLAVRAAALGPPGKARVLLDLLGRHAQQGERVIVFTAFRPALDELAALLERAGIRAAVYHGGLRRADKERAIEQFRTDVPVLLATESAGEGRNLQFCHVMVNFDLPWNPMQIEQRLGRIHRIGQTHEVLLTNLVSRGTVEDRMLGVLEAKINLFELVVGELDMILGRIDEDFDFESFVFRSHVEAADDGDFVSRLGALGDDLARAKRSYLESRGRNDDLVPEGGPAGDEAAS
jgi:SNF2 family DNA or RNA helicase